MARGDIRFCAYPSAFIRENPAGTAGKNLKKHLFWGDTVRLEGEAEDGWYPVSSRDETGWMTADELQPDALLDIIFLDVGQGDSCYIVTPKDEHIVVDAGPGDNLARYLRWRYKRFETEEMKAMGGKIKAFILSHPDSDHYGGIASLFKPDVLGTSIEVGTFFHNGLFPLTGAFGSAFRTVSVDGVGYVTNPIRTTEDLDRFVAQNRDRLNEFSKLIADIRRDHPEIDFRMLHDGCHGDAIAENVPGLSIDVVSPVLEGSEATPRLPVIEADPGVCKNGNSVIMRLAYKNVRILFSGDVNRKGEEYLLKHYGQDRFAAAVAADVFKVPHHGSSDFLDDFVGAVNPAVSLISSGDNEGYSHPRADALGTLGKLGRGKRPLVFSTELGRSIRIETAGKKGKAKAPAAAAGEGAATADTEKLKDRVVAVYGAINLRTDGCRVVMAQKKEARDSKGREWDLYCLAPAQGNGPLTYVPI